MPMRRGLLHRVMHIALRLQQRPSGELPNKSISLLNQIGGNAALVVFFKTIFKVYRICRDLGFSCLDFSYSCMLRG